MKRKCLILLGILVSLSLVTNCYAGFFGLFNDGVDGNGIIKTLEKKQLPEFSSVRIDGVFNVNINLSKSSNNINIQADSNLIPLIKTRINNNTLYINMNKDYNSDTRPEITVNTSQISSLHAKGVSIINVNNINCNKFSLSQSGVNTITLSGKTDDLKVHSKDVGKIFAENLIAENAEINLSDASKARVHVTNNLITYARDAGKVIYYGNPKEIYNKNSGYNFRVIKG
ncbi:MAG: hypothetical protein GY756_18735 [bacterium]|nr:hypothetical protein [bacterium]